MKTALLTLLALALPTLGFANDDQAQNYSFRASSPIVLRNLFRVYYPTTPLPSDGSEYTGKWKQVLLNSYSTEGPFKAKALSSIPFFTKPSAGSKRVATAKLTKSSKDLVLFFIGNEEKQSYACFSAENGKAPWGGYFISNKSPHNIMLQVGKVKKIIPPGKSGSINPGLGTHEVKLYTGTKQEPKMLRNTKWHTTENQREFVLYYGQKLRWVHIADNKQSETAQN